MYIDAHCDTAINLWHGDSLKDLPGAANDYCRLRNNLDVAFFALFLDINKYGLNAEKSGLYLLDRLLSDLAANAALVEPLLFREQLALARENSLVLIALEGGELLGREAEMLPLWYRLGLRSLGLTWNYRNQLADGCLEDGGLSLLGRKVVGDCNQLGILLDAAHLAKKGFYQLLDLSSAPIIVSHAACSGLCPHRRNLDDGQLRELSAYHGVIGITFVRDFLGGPAVDIGAVARHIAHAAEVAGVEHVAVGSDFDGAETAEGLKSVDDLPLLRQALRDIGFNDEEIKKIAGENIRRLLETTLPAREALK